LKNAERRIILRMLLVHLIISYYRPDIRSRLHSESLFKTCEALSAGIAAARTFSLAQNIDCAPAKDPTEQTGCNSGAPASVSKMMRGTPSAATEPCVSPNLLLE
jgi:hypothetical protein